MTAYSNIRWVGKVDTQPCRRMRRKNITRFMEPVKMQRLPIPWSMVADVVMAFASFGLLIVCVVLMVLIANGI